MAEHPGMNTPLPQAQAQGQQANAANAGQPPAAPPPPAAQAPTTPAPAEGQPVAPPQTAQAPTTPAGTTTVSGPALPPPASGTPGPLPPAGPSSSAQHTPLPPASSFLPQRALDPPLATNTPSGSASGSGVGLSPTRERTTDRSAAFTPRGGPGDVLPPPPSASTAPPASTTPTPHPTEPISTGPMMGPPLPPPPSSSTSTPGAGLREQQPPQHQQLPHQGPLPPPVWSHTPGLGPPPLPPPGSSGMSPMEREREQRERDRDRMQIDPPSRREDGPPLPPQLPGIASFGQLTPQPLGPPPPQHGHHHLPPPSHFVPGPPPPPQMHDEPGPPPPQQQQQMGPPPGEPEQEGRSLNVKDALTYLDQVKNEFTDRADVYNLFLDIMKDFKSQAIDTPRVIERVSQLFAGHNQLIQGFNTFLPPGYRIETMVDPSDPDKILVTTPAGTSAQHIPHSGGPRGYGPPVPGQSSLLPPPGAGYSGVGLPPLSAPPGGGPHYGLPQLGQFPSPQPMLPPPGGVHHTHAAPLGGHHPGGHYVPSAPHTPAPLIPGGPGTYSTSGTPLQLVPPGAGGPGPDPVPINHAMNFVNTIKVRFSDHPEKYKSFLDILQTYQQRARPIAEVFQQVNELFEGQEDLIKEFQEFLPDKGRYGFEALAGEGASQLASINAPSGSGGPMDSAGPSGARAGEGSLGAVAGRESRREREEREKRQREKEQKQQSRKKRPAAGPAVPEPAPSAQGSRGGPGAGQRGGAQQPASKKPKTSHGAKPESPPPPPPHGGQVQRASGGGGAGGAGGGHHHPSSHGPSAPAAPPAPTQAAQPAPAPIQPTKQNPVAYFDRLKKHINNNAVYAELLKLLNLYTQRMFDLPTLIQRARPFFHDPNSLSYWRDFLEVLDISERDAEGYLTGRAGAGPEAEIVGRDGERLVHPLERPRLNIDQLKPHGPSYRKLPKSEINRECSGRDALCWQVLNDQWISHPTWASEEAGFAQHKKNTFEEAMHRSEEERHEFDFHIEANIRTISMLEPINQRILTMDQEEKSKLRLPPGLGGQSKGVYTRIIKKVYPDTHAEVMQALQESPAIAVPVVLARLKQKDEEWRRAQREWNKVWREVEARNFYKSLDHMSATFKAEDKKRFNAKKVLDDIEVIKAAQDAQLRRMEDEARGIFPEPEKEAPSPEEEEDDGAKEKDEVAERIKQRKKKEKEKHRPVVVPSVVPGVPGKWQFENVMDDPSILRDVAHLVFSFMDRGSGSLSYSERTRAERLLRNWMPKVYGLDPEEFWRGFPAPPEESEDEDEQEEGDGTPANLAPPPQTRANGHVRRSHHAGASGSRKKKGGRATARSHQAHTREGTVMSEQLDVGGTATPEPGPSVDGDVEMAPAPAAEPTSGLAAPPAVPRAGTPSPPEHGNLQAEPGKAWIDVIQREDGPEAMARPLSSSDQPQTVSSARDEPVPPPTVHAPPAHVNGVVHEDVDMDADNSGAMVNGAAGSEASIVPLKVPERSKGPYTKRVFYANSTFYVLYRFIEMFYDRLHGLKYYDSPIWNEKPNPLAVELGLIEDTKYNDPTASDKSTVSAEALYRHLLSQVELFLEGKLEESVLTDMARNLYGPAAYVVVSFHAALGQIARVAKNAAEEEACKELLALFSADEPRQAAIKAPPEPGSEAMRADMRAQIIYRREAEKKIAEDKQLYRLEWEAGTGKADVMHVALLRKDDPSGEEPEGVREKWRMYIDTYTINAPTETHLRYKPSHVFLRKLVPPNASEIKHIPGFASSSKLQIRVCVRTYKLFFVPGSEEWMVIHKGAQEVQALEKRREERRQRGLERMRAWVEGRVRRAAARA